MRCAILGALVGGWALAATAGAAVLVEAGQPRAEIVVAQEPPRLVKLAAEELQAYVEKMSGATLPIVTERSGERPVAVYVGRSAHTDELGLDDEGLSHGAFRMVSGPDWLALLGQDFDYAPIEPWPRGPGDRARADGEWDKITGAKWRNPMSDGRQFNREMGIWAFDEGGSLTAVYEFLRSLGVEWFMPGEIGEVVPTMATIPLPEADETVRPDYPVRHWIHGSSFGNAPRETILFERRMGVNSLHKTLGAGQLTHGIRNVHARPEMQEAHPEYYALIAGERDTETRGTGHVCYSSRAFAEEVANYARAVFDHFDERVIQLSPQDGFRQCECAECRGMTPSDNVFRFLDWVAREVRETHPDRLILGAAYGSYREPPEIVERFSPNFTVSVNNLGRPRFADENFWEAYQELVEGWLRRLSSGRVLRVENTRYGANPIPAIHPRSIAKDLRAMKGSSLGERNEINRDFPGATHLSYYVMGRYYWDAERDIEALLDDYYARFYGPAGDAMRKAFDFAEARYARGEARGWFDRRKALLSDQIRFWEMVQAAREEAGQTVYGERIDVLLSEASTPLDEVRRELSRLEERGDPRARAPRAVVAEADTGQEPRRYFLADRVTGRRPEIATEFTVVWQDGSLVFEILCHEPDMENLRVSEQVWLGDTVAVLLETPFHSHYHLEINPDGKIYDRAWHTAESQRWASQAIVQTERGEDFWRATIRVPVVNEREGAGDPFHFVVGDKPTPEEPWYFNLGRARVRGQEKSVWLFSPTGGGNFHQPEHFGQLAVEP